MIMRPKKQKYKKYKANQKVVKKWNPYKKAAWKSTSPGKPETGNQKLCPYKMMPENAI